MGGKGILAFFPCGCKIKNCDRGSTPQPPPKQCIVMKQYKITMKEVGTERPLESFYYGDVSREYLIDFYGLKQPDIEWYNIEEVAE